MQTVTSIEESGPAADPSLEDDDDYEDVPGVLQYEQAAATLENIRASSEEVVEFDETLIPQDGVTEVTDELKTVLSE